MRLDVPRRGRSVVGLTSLIDVIFLLLLFFMLSSTFSRYSQLDLGVAGVGAGVGGERPKLIIGVLEDGSLRLNGRVIPGSDLATEIAALVDKDVKRAVVVPKGDVRLQQLVSTLEALKQTSLQSVSLAR